MARPSFTDKQKVVVYEYCQGECNDCHTKLLGEWVDGGTTFRPKKTFTIRDARIHHITPVCLGGKHNLDNWVLLCVPCHNERHRYISYIQGYYYNG